MSRTIEYGAEINSSDIESEYIRGRAQAVADILRCLEASQHDDALEYVANFVRSQMTDVEEYLDIELVQPPLQLEIKLIKEEDNE